MQSVQGRIDLFCFFTTASHGIDIERTRKRKTCELLSSKTLRQLCFVEVDDGQVERSQIHLSVCCEMLLANDTCSSFRFITCPLSVDGRHVMEAG